MEVGDKIRFGTYNWIVLDKKDNKVMVISEYIIERRPYHNEYKDTTWADCSLRKYLNDEFYNKFSIDEKRCIMPVINMNPDNPWYGSNGGKDTKDNIFLLNVEETVCKYFGDSSTLLLHPGKNQKYWFQRKDKNNCNRIASDVTSKTGSWWWLRSPGRVSIKAVYIHGDGNIGIQGNNILKGNISDGTCRGGVRPAMWLKL